MKVETIETHALKFNRELFNSGPGLNVEVEQSMVEMSLLLCSTTDFSTPIIILVWRLENFIDKEFMVEMSWVKRLGLKCPYTIFKNVIWIWTKKTREILIITNQYLHCTAKNAQE